MIAVDNGMISEFCTLPWMAVELIINIQPQGGPIIQPEDGTGRSRAIRTVRFPYPVVDHGMVSPLTSKSRPRLVSLTSLQKLLMTE